MNDIILSKKISIERWLKQIDQYYRMETSMPFVKDQLRLGGGDEFAARCRIND
ncbi:hypothetical protein [Nitrosomonas communis]|uniref:Uncharacterized protein n=1 Tax=Nitrosomonas communis TaxID=44574 RepID=A0A1H2W9H9_9PROT|nr:hypothetical protein [Nitrosomonas communis]SDW77191.1 hypothetical protein SAMN05421882_102726 [Nitrosomonas communis]